MLNPHPKDPDYLLGVNREEFERLQFQHSVWKGVTDSFLDRLDVERDWRCLDVGAGPGFVSFDLRERVGDAGEIILLEPSSMYGDWAEDRIGTEQWQNVRLFRTSAESADLPSDYFDLIYARWVFSFVTNPEHVLRRLIPALKPGGIIAIQDYAYEGLSIFPRGGAFDAMPAAVKKYYRSGGGDPDVGPRLYEAMRREGLEVIDLKPNCLCGGPESGIFEWGFRFFVSHIPLMAEKGILSKEEATAVLENLHSHRHNPHSLFFSPIVLDLAGRKPVDG